MLATQRLWVPIPKIALLIKLKMHRKSLWMEASAECINVECKSMCARVRETETEETQIGDKRKREISE